MNPMIVKMWFEDNVKYPNVNSSTAGDGSDLGIIVEGIKKGIIQLGEWIINGIVNGLYPWITWGCKAVIVFSVIVHQSSPCRYNKPL
ncbi:MAG TPA: hypothetical protein VHQ24_15295 [Lachnospiraceae bacterium]|nr:hypothetical protein [Lachnospiraceae bacterium]